MKVVCALRSRFHLRRRLLQGPCAPHVAQPRPPDQRSHRHRSLPGPLPGYRPGANQHHVAWPRDALDAILNPPDAWPRDHAAQPRATGQLRSPSKHALPGGSDPPSVPLNRNRSTLQPLSVSPIHPEPAPHPQQEMFLQLRGSGLTRNPAAPSIRLQRVLIPETDCAPCRGSTRAFPVV